MATRSAHQKYRSTIDDLYSQCRAATGFGKQNDSEIHPGYRFGRACRKCFGTVGRVKSGRVFGVFTTLRPTYSVVYIVGMSSDASKQVASPLMMREQHHPRPPNKALRVLWCSEGKYDRSEREGDAAVGIIRRLFTKTNKGENRSVYCGGSFSPLAASNRVHNLGQRVLKQRPRPKK